MHPRTGNYSLKKYRKAIPFFEKVLKNTPEDLVAKEYLYYSFLLGNQVEDARKVLHSFNEKQKEKLSFYNTNNLFNSLGFEYKYYSFDNYKISNEVNNEIIQKKRNSMSYYSADLLNYSEGKTVSYFNFSLLRGSNSIFDSSYSPEIIDEDLRQYQFYFSWKKQIAKGTSIKIGLTYMRESLKWYDSQWSSGNGFGSSSSNTLIYDGATNNFVGFLSVLKSIGNVDLSAGSSASKINSEIQIQPFISFDYYPFGNQHLFTKTTIFYQNNFNDNSKNNFTFKQSIGTNIGSRLSINIFGLYGSVSNFIDNEGLTIYNSLDAIDYWYGASANYTFNNKSQLYIHLRNDGQTNEYSNNTVTEEIKYNVKSILVGYRFNF